MGGGVSAAILRAGGQSILIDAAKKIPAKPGDVVVTSAGSLRAQHIFHAITIGDESVGPRKIVERATQRCLELMDTLGLNSIAFPAIGAGVAGFEYEEVASHMAAVIVGHLSTSRRAVNATIYLYDRFGRMEVGDFITFFEQFAIHTKGLSPVATRLASVRRAPRRHPASKPNKQEQRKKRLLQLGELEHERQALESRLAEYDGALNKTEIKRVEQELKRVHETRIGVLAEVKPTISASAASIFVSYSHADEPLRRKLGKHLAVLERQGLVAVWHDRMITAGTEWEGVIDHRLRSSRLILLLVSADFIASKYCYDVEMATALKMHEGGKALVIPIMMRPVSMDGTPFAKLQALPKDARAVTDWSNRDNAMVDITEGIRSALQTLDARPLRKTSRPRMSRARGR
jgi:O-acetyl-ADP-ribose deacetylase (regulator of RNase III)